MTCWYCGDDLVYNGACQTCDRPDFGLDGEDTEDSVYETGEVLHHIATLERTKVLADFRPFEVE